MSYWSKTDKVNLSELRQLLGEGATNKHIAEVFGLNPKTVSRSFQTNPIWRIARDEHYKPPSAKTELPLH